MANIPCLRRQTIKYHKSNVHGKNRFPCRHCERVFKRLYNLKRHEKLYNLLKTRSQCLHGNLFFPCTLLLWYLIVWRLSQGMLAMKEEENRMKRETWMWWWRWWPTCYYCPPSLYSFDSNIYILWGIKELRSLIKDCIFVSFNSKVKLLSIFLNVSEKNE